MLDIEHQFRMDQPMLIGCCSNTSSRKLHLYRLGEHYRIYCTSCHAIVDHKDYATAVELYREGVFDIQPITDIATHVSKKTNQHSI